MLSISNFLILINTMQLKLAAQCADPDVQIERLRTPFCMAALFGFRSEISKGQFKLYFILSTINLPGVILNHYSQSVNS